MRLSSNPLPTLILAFQPRANLPLNPPAYARAVSERTESAGFPRVLDAFAEILKSSPVNMIQLDRSPL